LIVLVKYVQQAAFGEDMRQLLDGKHLSSKSKILSLNPFVDPQGLLRVGGRLRHAPISFDKKHPILLPRQSELTTLIVRSFHLENCHAGSQLLYAVIQQQFWIIRGQDLCRFIAKRCVKCTRLAATTLQQFMGDLPSARVTASPPFNRCGIDYAGPISLKSDVPRSKVTFKGYLCLFVCFSTRAIHIEVVKSLSTEASLAALRRFSSRRNSPSDIFAYCGTNFTGAAKELKDVQKFLNKPEAIDQLTREMTTRGITWHFNPPGAPHFGGLWEAGVKSVKHPLLGSATLTFEEMCTLTCQIEACLNSRPLTAISADPSDLQGLTPGHFLTGAPLNAVPEKSLMDLKTTHLDRWQLVQQMQQRQRWSQEFITWLQQRPKWLKQRTQPRIDDLVVIKDERLPPLQWKLGRIQQLHPGADGLTLEQSSYSADSRR
jgi:hypothetical protein